MSAQWNLWGGVHSRTLEVERRSVRHQSRSPTHRVGKAEDPPSSEPARGGRAGGRGVPPETICDLFLVLLSVEVSEWDPVRSSCAKWEPAPGSAGEYDPTKERLVCRQLPPGGRDASSGVKAKSCTHEE
jgi:hypothetical protein